MNQSLDTTPPLYLLSSLAVTQQSESKANTIFTEGPIVGDFVSSDTAENPQTYSQVPLVLGGGSGAGGLIEGDSSKDDSPAGSATTMAAKCFLSVPTLTLDGLALLNTTGGSLSFGSNTIELFETHGGGGNSNGPGAIFNLDSLDIPNTQSPNSNWFISNCSSTTGTPQSTSTSLSSQLSADQPTSRFLISPTDFLTLNPEESSKIRRDVSLSSTSLVPLHITGGGVSGSGGSGGSVGGPGRPVTTQAGGGGGSSSDSSFTCSNKLKSLVRDALSAGNSRPIKRRHSHSHHETFCESPPNSIVLSDDDEDEGVEMETHAGGPHHSHHHHPHHHSNHQHHHLHHPTLQEHFIHKNSPLMCGVDVDEEESDDVVVSHHTLPLSPNASGGHAFDDDLIIMKPSSLVGVKRLVHSAPLNLNGSRGVHDENSDDGDDDDLFGHLTSTTANHHANHQDDSLIGPPTLISIPLTVSGGSCLGPTHLIPTSSIVDSLVPNSLQSHHHQSFAMLDLCHRSADDAVVHLSANNLNQINTTTDDINSTTTIVTSSLVNSGTGAKLFNSSSGLLSVLTPVSTTGESPLAGPKDLTGSEMNGILVSTSASESINSNSTNCSNAGLLALLTNPKTFSAAGGGSELILSSQGTPSITTALVHASPSSDLPIVSTSSGGILSICSSSTTPITSSVNVTNNQTIKNSKMLKPIVTSSSSSSGNGPAPLTFAPPPLAANNDFLKSEKPNKSLSAGTKSSTGANAATAAAVTSAGSATTMVAAAGKSAFQYTRSGLESAACISQIQFPEMMKIPIIGGNGLISKDGVLQLSPAGGSKLSQAGAATCGIIHQTTGPVSGQPGQQHKNATTSTFALQVIRQDGTSIMVPMPTNPAAVSCPSSSSTATTSSAAAAASFAQTLSKFIQSSAANVLSPISSGTPVTIIGATPGLAPGGADSRRSTTILQAVKTGGGTTSTTSTSCNNTNPTGSLYGVPTKVTIQIAADHSNQILHKQLIQNHSTAAAGSAAANSNSSSNISSTSASASPSASSSSSSSSSSFASSSPGHVTGGGGGAGGQHQHHHHATSSSSSRPFKCELCNSTFTRLGNYTRHKKIHSLPTKEDQRFRCDVCSKSFIQRCDLARHLHIHRGTEPHRCPQCGKGYIRHSDLVTHQRFHNKEKPFGCPHCSKGFCQRGDLNRHLRSIHLQMKPVLCTFCHKKFAKEETLLRHINANHREQVHVVQATASVAAAAAAAAAAASSAGGPTGVSTSSLDLPCSPTTASSGSTNGTITTSAASAAVTTLNGLLAKNNLHNHQSHPHHQIISISSAALKNGQLQISSSGGSGAAGGGTTASSPLHLSLSSLLTQHAGAGTLVKTLTKGPNPGNNAGTINLLATTLAGQHPNSTTTTLKQVTIVQQHPVGKQEEKSSISLVAPAASGSASTGTGSGKDGKTEIFSSKIIKSE